MIAIVAIIVPNRDNVDSDVTTCKEELGLSKSENRMIHQEEEEAAYNCPNTHASSMTS